ncbi:hypothetical protein [Spirosoma aureum]|uniref:hypothetical protein n=1 Tax=Spirosoma aureum TaxID=2692134 RepID=UPI0018D7B678|nr:hypothetical protein [Spirosoma aureum]
MTLDKPHRRNGLDQIEPILADVAQKTDRLIESNGQIFQLATETQAQVQKVVQQADSTARGLANLTVSVNQRFDQLTADVNHQFVQINHRFVEVDHRFDQQQSQFESLRGEVQLGLEQLDTKIDSNVDGLQEEIKFPKDTQIEILTILKDRLK